MESRAKLQKSHLCYLTSARVDLEVDKEPTSPPIQDKLANWYHAIREQKSKARAHITLKNGCCSDWSAVGLFNGSQEHNCYGKARSTYENKTQKSI